LVLEEASRRDSSLRGCWLPEAAIAEVLVFIANSET
jgi:hypothetical protein